MKRKTKRTKRKPTTGVNTTISGLAMGQLRIYHLRWAQALLWGGGETYQRVEEDRQISQLRSPARLVLHLAQRKARCRSSLLVPLLRLLLDMWLSELLPSYLRVPGCKALAINPTIHPLSKRNAQCTAETRASHGSQAAGEHQRGLRLDLPTLAILQDLRGLNLNILLVPNHRLRRAQPKHAPPLLLCQLAHGRNGERSQNSVCPKSLQLSRPVYRRRLRLRPRKLSHLLWQQLPS